MANSSYYVVDPGSIPVNFWIYSQFLVELRSSWTNYDLTLSLRLNFDHPFFLFSVDALLEIKRSLLDPNGNLSNWNRGDPCISKWTGVLCYSSTLDDNYLHVAELYDF